MNLETQEPDKKPNNSSDLNGITSVEISSTRKKFSSKLNEKVGGSYIKKNKKK